MGTTTSQPGYQTTADVNAILQGMTDANVDRLQARRAQQPQPPAALPPQVQPNYQPPMPTALQPTQPQQSPAPWAQPQQQAGILPREQLPPNLPPQLQPPAQQPLPQQFGGVDTSLARDPTGRNNPGNLRTGSGRGGPTDFQRFPTMQAGIQALQNNLLAYQDRYGLNTIAGIVSRWTPPTENDTERAIQQAEGVMQIGRNQRIDLHDPATMTRMTNAILFNEQHGTRGGRGNLNEIRDQYTVAQAGPGGMNLPTPQQNLMQPTPRGYNEWGHPPPGFGMSQPGAMPQPNQFAHIMQAVAPLLVGIASLAMRMPLSTAITAYGAMERAQQNGQNLEYQRNRTQWRDRLGEATARQTDESREAGDAFALYGNNNPQGLQQRLMEIALTHNDPDMYRAAERGDFDAIHRLQQQRDLYNQDLIKLHKAQDEEQQRQDIQADVAARDAQWDRENPGATPEQRAIAHAQHEGQARGDVKAPSQSGLTEGPPYNVVDQNGKPTGRRVIRSKQGGWLDADTGQPTQLGPGEQPEGIPRQRQAPAQPDIPPGWVKPGTKVPPPEPDQQQTPPTTPPPAAAPAGGGGGDDQGQGEGGGGDDQGDATQAPPAADQTADQQQPYQVAQAGPGVQPPPSQQQPTQAYPGPKYSPPDEVQQLGPNGDQTARDMLRGNENAVKLAPKAVQPLVTGGYNALQRQVDDVNNRASLPEGDPRRLAPNQIMPALRDIDPGYADDVGSVLRYDRAVPSGGGFGAGMSPFWNGMVNLAHKIDNNWMPQNYDRVKEFGNQNQRTQQTIQLTATLASTGASVLRDIARIPDFDGTAFQNAWKSWLETGQGDPKYTTLLGDWQSFIIEANRLRTVSGSVVESEQQIGVLAPGGHAGGSLLGRGIVPASAAQFRDLIKNELTNSYPKVQGFKEEWQALKPGVRMPGQAYIDRGDPTIQAILHMSPTTGNYYGVPVPPELGGTGATVPADSGDAAALTWAQSHPEDPKSIQIMQGLREKGVY